MQERFKVGDNQGQPTQPPIAKEPCDRDVTLEMIESTLKRWENTVSYYADQFDTDDDFHHEVFGRYCLHGLLNGFTSAGNTLPEALKTRLEAADKAFIAFTLETNNTFWNRFEHHDKTLFWYYYRFPQALKS